MGATAGAQSPSGITRGKVRTRMMLLTGSGSANLNRSARVSRNKPWSLRSQSGLWTLDLEGSALRNAYAACARAGPGQSTVKGATSAVILRQLTSEARPGCRGDCRPFYNKECKMWWCLTQIVGGCRAEIVSRTSARDVMQEEGGRGVMSDGGDLTKGSQVIRYQEGTPTPSSAARLAAK